jgi:hypothetical protein
VADTVLVIVFVSAGAVTVTVGAGAFGVGSAAALPHPATARTASDDPASSALFEFLIELAFFLHLHRTFVHK